MLAFKMRYYLRGVFDTLSSDNRRMVRSLSAHELGMKHFDETTAGKHVDKYIFKFGLMRMTEHFNRYASVLTAVREQRMMVDVLKTYSKDSKAYKNVVRKLDKFYKLTTEEISLMQKHGIDSENINSANFKNIYEHGKIVRKVQTINQKMLTLAHINTQGASMSLFMPEWASGPFAKPLLLYKRMAYAATVNTTRNVKLAWDSGSPLAVAFFGMGTYLSGETLSWVYKNLLGTSLPHSNSNAGKQLQVTLWKGEFMGILSEFINPEFNIFGKNNTKYLTQPAIYGQVALMFSSLQATVMGRKFLLEGKPLGVGQVVNDIGRGSMGLWNGISKIRERTLNPYHRSGMKFRKLRKEYNAEMAEAKDFVPDTSLYSQFEKSKYSSAFWDYWHMGSKAERAEWYVINLFSQATDFYREGRAPGIIKGEVIEIRNWPEALKQSAVELKKTVTNLNPARDVKVKKDGTLNITDRRQIGFYKWIARNEYEALKKKNPKLANTSSGRARLWREAFKVNKNLKELIKIKQEYGQRRRQLVEYLPEYYSKQKIDKLLEKFGLKRTIL